MRLVPPFLRMIRWSNLVFIALTQVLFYYAVYVPLFAASDAMQLSALVAASVFIAAGGYVINDYFDLNIDQINKPDKNVLNAIISRRWALFWHLFLSLAGIVFTAVATQFNKGHLVAANIVCVILLWLYSTSFKRQLLIGNILISVLTAWTVLIVFFIKVPFAGAFNSDVTTSKFFRVSFLYAGFAFVISIIREAIKDIEDLVGDERYGCHTLPIVAGIRATKIYVAVWNVVLIAALLVLQLYVLQFRWYAAVAYSILLIITPLVYFFIKLLKANTTAEFARLSAVSKWIMFSGILSMIFFRIYF